MARALRIFLLLLVLATVAEEAWLARARTTSWQNTVFVALYPANGDGSAAAAAHIRALQPEHFKAIERFVADEARRHSVTVLRPVEILLAPPLTSLPPQAPPQASALEAVVWSLKLRWWASRNDDVAGPRPGVRIFLAYFDPATHTTLPHSVGLQRGQIGIANLFASDEMTPQNNVVIAHELLHTLGATDKYEPGSNQPRFPEGYAEPGRQPRLPQEYAEIMAGRTPLSEAKSVIPDSLEHTRVGPATAAEIRWTGT